LPACAKSRAPRFRHADIDDKGIVAQRMNSHQTSFAIEITWHSKAPHLAKQADTKEILPTISRQHQLPDLGSAR